jgi:hypothetical protein
MMTTHPIAHPTDRFPLDREFGDDLARLGFTAPTAAAFWFLPLVETAWAEGSVSGPERRTILAAAERRGLAPGSPAYDLLLEWLENRPPDELFDGAVLLTERALASLSAPTREVGVRALLDGCARVAEASGGVVGFVGRRDNVCPEEREVLHRLAARLS